MIGKIKMMAIITFYVAVLLVIAVYLQDGSGTFSHFFENANLYIRNLRNVHAPAFHQTYDNYLQLFPLILLFGLKLGGIRGNFGWKRLQTAVIFGNGHLVVVHNHDEVRSQFGSTVQPFKSLAAA